METTDILGQMLEGVPPEDDELTCMREITPAISLLSEEAQQAFSKYVCELGLEPFSMVDDDVITHIGGWLFADSIEAGPEALDTVCVLAKPRKQRTNGDLTDAA